jgi:hypothetical protein
MARISNLAYLHICSTCFDLFDQERPDGRNQRCRCSRPQHDEPWPGFDFNRRATLCLCCATDVLESGSRWSPFFCRECQLMAMGVSLWERHLVFPIGRHSMMHNWVPKTPPATPIAHGGNAAGPALSVYTTLKAVFSGSDLLEQWSQRYVAENLARLRLRGGVSLVRYLAAQEKAEERPTRCEAFAAMCEFVRYAPRTHEPETP